MGNIAQKGSIAICPTTECEYLTSHKEYIITKANSDGTFVILDDNGKQLFCKTIECGHLNNGKSWTFK